MSKAANSPTARLLQSSRLFSLPRPLPASSLETPSSTGTYRASDSATQLYPTHQAIATPASAHHRGDWGLKRAIPGKTTRSSTPTIRVLGQDTPDHITEFESAADHERSREKWAEMGVPIVMRGKREGVTDTQKNVSVYEEFLDNTDPNTAPVELRHRSKGKDRRNDTPTTMQPQRWKHSGPHIADMQEGEFQRYIERELKERRAEWEHFLIDELAKEDLKKERDEAFANARHFGPIESAPPERQKEMVLREAENKAKLLSEEERESVMAEARLNAQEYEEESKRMAAPFEAQTVLDRAEREAAIERPKIERNGDDFGKRTEALERMLAAAGRQAHQILGVTHSETLDSATLEDAYKLVEEAEKVTRKAEENKLQIQQAWEAERLVALRLSGDALAARQKELRDEHASNRLSSSLTKHVAVFLDIPAVHASTDSSSSPWNQRLYEISQNLEMSPGTSDDAPPTTHPAAGLSHLRTNAYLPNHPVYGPQAYSSPILARVLQARNSNRQVIPQADLGVGGFVARDSATSTFQNNRNNKDGSTDPTQWLNPNQSGGGKVWVHPKNAFVDNGGRVHLSVERADQEALAVKTDDVEPILRARSGGAPRPQSVMMPEPRRANYGTAMPDMRRKAMDEGRMQSRSGVRGFDQEIGQGVDEESAMRRIAELSREMPGQGR